MLSKDLISAIRQNLPNHLRNYLPKLVFTIDFHGCSIHRLVNAGMKGYYHVIIMKTSTKLVGAVLNEPPTFSFRGRYYGNSHTFIFVEDDMHFKIYRVPDVSNGHLISVEETNITIGGSSPAIYISNNFEMLISNPCEAFACPQLVEDSQIIAFEMYRLCPF